jgi:hypothetical protein
MALRPVDLVPWPKEKKSQKVAEHRDGSNDEGDSDDGEKGNKSTNSSLGESEDDQEVQIDDEDSEHIDGRKNESRFAVLKSGGSEVGLVSVSSACNKVVNSKRSASSVPEHGDGKRRKAKTRNDSDCVLKKRQPAKDCGNAPRIKDCGSEMDEGAITNISASTVGTKALETKRKASRAPKHPGDKQQKYLTRNDTGSTMEEERRAGNDDGYASVVKAGSAWSKASDPNGRASAPTFPVGTRFRKDFPGHGTFQGTIISFDGVHYKVHYPSDGDSEELSDYELDDVELIEIPPSRARATNKKIDR